MSINPRRRKFASWHHKNGLFYAIVAWIILAIIAYTLLSAIWGYGHGWSRILAGWRVGATHDPLDRIKVTLTALGGVGAVGYLVIKYRERAALERGEADEKLVRAVQQLGDPSPQVRIAGVYALADVADTYEGPYHQRVVDILCGYLRTDRLLKDANGDTRYATNDDGTPNYDQPLSADGAVESTIISTLASHLRASRNTTQGSWSHCAIDLHGAIFTEIVNFSNTHINRLTCRATTYLDEANFSKAFFQQGAEFSHTHFRGFAHFDSTEFVDLAEFREASFENKAFFEGSTFKCDATFENCTFKKEAYFTQSRFVRKCNFQRATFGSSSHFGSTKFVENTKFNFATFAGNLHFECAIFSGALYFIGVAVYGESSFHGAKFKLTLILSSKFCDAVTFKGATFEKTADFARTSFQHFAIFRPTNFLDGCLFYETKFNSDLRDCFLISFPTDTNLGNNGLPVGGKWHDFTSIELEHSAHKCRESPANEQGQPDKASPTDSLLQDEDEEEDGDEDAQLVDGDHHTGQAILEGSVVAEPGNTGGSPGGQDKTELTARHGTYLSELAGDGHHHPGHHQDHPGTYRGTEVGLHPRDAGLTEDRGERGEEG